MNKITEQSSNYNNLEQMSVFEILHSINKEDQSVAQSIETTIPIVDSFCKAVIDKMKKGGRLFYIGAGTSGRLGILDASECPPTFGVDDNQIIGLIAGGDKAIRKAVENAEDSETLAWENLQKRNICNKDVVLGIAASGTTTYVVAGLKKCQEENILTACLTCNQSSPLSKVSDHVIEVVVGPEFLTGSTRMKAGTAQKMVLNMISTSVMIKLGKVHGNKMVDMKLANKKLVERGALMISEYLNLSFEESKRELAFYGSVRDVLLAHKKIS